MKEPIRVLVADDHAILREGIIKTLETETSIEVVGEAGNGKEAVKIAKELMPDVILMDISMPELNGIEATRKIIEDSPHISVIVLTVSDNPQDLVEAIKAGAIGYLIKDTAKKNIIEAIKNVYKREAIISPSIAISLLDEFKKLVDEKQKSLNKVEVLTKRETETLKLLAQGMDNKAISKILFVSDSTVKNHIRNILTKLHLENRVQASVLAAKEGLV